MTKKGQGWNAGRIIVAVAGYFDWFNAHMMTEFEVDGGRADVVFITKAGQLTEIEIKVSVADWNADRDKAKFTRPRPHISRFYYAIPETLADKIPAWVPEGVGILVVKNDGWRDHAKCLRAAKRVRAEKVSDAAMRSLFKNCYYRYWRQQLRLLRDRFEIDRTAAQ